MHTDLAIRGCAHAARQALGHTNDPRRLHEAEDYFAHTVAGIAMRDIARRRGVHPSTVLRAVRRLEARRDDPLHDALFGEVEALMAASGGPQAFALAMETALPNLRSDDPAADLRLLEKEARRILRRLSEPRAFLAMARGADTACVFRPGDGGPVTLAKVAVRVVRDFAGRDWIACAARGRAMAKYEITEAGRSWLKRVLIEDGDQRRRMAEAPGIAIGMAEASSVFARQHQIEGERIDVENGVPCRMNVNLGETPLGWLARRKGPDGSAFLSPEEVVAGERLREDFELAQLGPKVAQDWTRFLAPVDESGISRLRTPCDGPVGARDRLAGAMKALGPGLNDVALRACCFLEGLEATERRMGWSARSGKVVLKIALTRLAEHYGLCAGRRGRHKELRKAV
jgi:DNA-binding CsgD family transcriptional regulator